MLITTVAIQKESISLSKYIFYESCHEWILFLEDNENWAFVSRLFRDSVGKDPRII